MTIVTQSVLTAFGEAVKEARSKKGWTLKQLSNEAEGANHSSFLSNIEKGKRKIGATTAGRLVNALNMDTAWVDKFLRSHTAQTDEITTQDRRAEAMLSSAEKDGETGVAESLMIALAYEYAQGENIDLDGAYRSLRAALQTARDMRDRAALPDNTDASVTAIRAEVNRINEAEGPEAGTAYLAEALAQKSAEMGALLDLGIQQARLENDPKAAAEYLLERLRMEVPAGDWFEAIRMVQDTWYIKGRDAGLAYEATVAIHLAEATVDMAVSADQRGTGLNELGIALSTLGERESGSDRLEEAVAANREALQERTRNREPLDWAMTQNNLGNALTILGKRESGTDQLKEALTAYRAALRERKRDRVPLGWARTQENVALLEIVFFEKTKDAMYMRDALTSAKNAQEVYLAADAAYYIEKIMRLIAGIETALRGANETPDG